MTNLDPNPELVNAPHFAHGLSTGFAEKFGSDYIVEVLEPRPVPLGGPRAMTVQRTLPQRARSLIGAWCFLDYFGPDDVAESGGMQVPRHPHTGLATVSWLFEGRVDHIDSAGNWALIRPGEVNLMSAGYGITHSEYSTPDTTVLHGVQLWYAFPEQQRFVAPQLDQHRPETITGPGWEATVAIGSLLGVESPVETYSPLSAAEISLEPNTTMEIVVPTEHEHGLLAIECTANFNGAWIEENHLGYLGTGVTTLKLSSGDSPIRVMLIGGEPLDEDIVMWWNFVGRSHDEIALWRERYQTEMGFEIGDGPSRSVDSCYPDGTMFPQYGDFPSDQPAPLPAPELPSVAMRPRSNPPTIARRKEHMRPEFHEQDGYISMTIDGVTAGREVYRNHETDGIKQRIFVETVVEEDYRGAGLAGQLVKYSLDNALDAGYRIVAICPYVKKWIENADDQRYRDATDTARPEHFS